MHARKIVVAGLAAAVAGSGFAAAGASAATHATAKKKAAKCVTWSDPAGDAFPADSPASQPADDSLDITGVTYSVSQGVANFKILVPKYADSGKYSDGYRYDVDFTVGGKTIDIFANHGKLWDAALNQAFAQQGIKVGGTYVKGSSALVTRSAANNVVTLSVKVADLSTVAGVPIAGAVASEMDAVSWGQYEAVAEPYDTAPAPSGTTFTFAECK